MREMIDMSIRDIYKRRMKKLGKKFDKGIVKTQDEWYEKAMQIEKELGITRKVVLLKEPTERTGIRHTKSTLVFPDEVD